MSEIVGIRFQKAGRVYYFDPVDIDLEVSDYIIVTTARGLKLGKVVIAPKQVLASELTGPLKPVMRKAKSEDIKRAQEYADKEAGALTESSKFVAKLHLPMKLLSAEYNFDGSRLTMFFKAAKRVDFRELVQQLTNHFKIRVELRQVGPRDEAKLIEGFGRCGRPLCCANFLSEFVPVSIKMAKAQDVPLSPMKTSGCCGRLLCCLAYEYEQYHTLKKKLPQNGQQMFTPTGVANMASSDPPKEKETVLDDTESQTTVELPLNEITIDDEHPHQQGGED